LPMNKVGGGREREREWERERERERERIEIIRNEKHYQTKSRQRGAKIK
jgi:hypothetical protein